MPDPQDRLTAQAPVARKRRLGDLIIFALLLLQCLPLVVLGVSGELVTVLDAHTSQNLKAGEGVLMAFAGVAFVSLYYLPTIIALIRWHMNTVPVFIINAVFGWTLLGWVGALAWSFSSGVIPKSGPDVAPN